MVLFSPLLETESAIDFWASYEMRATLHRLLGRQDGNLTGGSQCATGSGFSTSIEQPACPLTPWKVHLAQTLSEQRRSICKLMRPV